MFRKNGKLHIEIAEVCSYNEKKYVLWEFERIFCETRILSAKVTADKKVGKNDMENGNFGGGGSNPNNKNNQNYKNNIFSKLDTLFKKFDNCFK